MVSCVQSGIDVSLSNFTKEIDNEKCEGVLYFSLARACDGEYRLGNTFKIIFIHPHSVFCRLKCTVQHSDDISAELSLFG